MGFQWISVIWKRSTHKTTQIYISHRHSFLSFSVVVWQAKCLLLNSYLKWAHCIIKIQINHMLSNHKEQNMQENCFFPFFFLGKKISVWLLPTKFYCNPYAYIDVIYHFCCSPSPSFASHCLLHENVKWFFIEILFQFELSSI